MHQKVVNVIWQCSKCIWAWRFCLDSWHARKLEGQAGEFHRAQQLTGSTLEYPKVPLV
jgi:hypothetical protein